MNRLNSTSSALPNCNCAELGELRSDCPAHGHTGNTGPALRLSDMIRKPTPVHIVYSARAALAETEETNDADAD